MIPPPRGSRLCPRAFTLVELLVVIMIIAILAAMLFPAIKGMPAQANAAKCVSNLRQIGAGMAGYSAEAGRFPPRYGPSPLGPYSWYWSDYCLTYIDSAFTKNVGSGASAGIAYYNVGGVGRGFYMAGSKEIRTAHPIFDCPGLANPIKDDEGKPYSTGATHQYHYNGMLDDGFEGGVALSTHRANIEKPSHFIVVMDTDSGYLETFGGPSFNPASFAKEYIPSHLGGFHALYADGHVSREKMSLITDYKKQGGHWVLPWANSTEEFSYPSQ